MTLSDADIGSIVEVIYTFLLETGDNLVGAMERNATTKWTTASNIKVRQEKFIRDYSFFFFFFKKIEGLKYLSRRNRNREAAEKRRQQPKLRTSLKRRETSPRQPYP